MTNPPAPKAAKAKGKAKQKGPAAAAVVSAPTPEAPPEADDGGGETAIGPVDGFVAKRSGTATKTDTPIVETPRSISVVTADQIDKQKVDQVDEALLYTPGVFADYRGLEIKSDLVLRGFFGGPVFRDGLSILSGSYGNFDPDAYGLERVEVIRGPASSLYGQSTPGGLVNLITKRPTDEPFAEVETRVGNYDQIGAAFDFGGAVDPAGKVTYRLTGLGRQNDTQIDLTNDEDRIYLAPALTWRPSAGTSLTLLSSYQRDKGVPTLTLPASGTFLFNPNGHIGTGFSGSEPFFDRYQGESFSTAYFLEHRLDPTWLLRHSLRYGEYDTHLQQIYGQGLEADQRTLSRGVFVVDDNGRGLATDSSAEAKFRTGPIQHTFLVGVDYRKSWYSELWSDDYTTFPSIDAFAPVYGQPIVIPAPYVAADNDIGQLGFYMQEQIKIYDGLMLSVGGRHDRVRQQRDERVSASSADEVDSDNTYNVGLVYLFDNGIAPYASYSESFQPQLGADRHGELFDPTTAQQEEAGVKLQPIGSNLLLTLAAYRLVQQNVLVTDDVDPNFSQAIGEVESKGFEVELKASLFDKSLNLAGGYAYTDSRVTKSSDFDGLVGLRPPTVPEHTASMWADYKFKYGLLDGFGFGGGVRYVGSTFDYLNITEVPSFTLFDAMLSYDFKGELEGVNLSINAANVFDESYIASCDDVSFCYYGRRRSVLATLKRRW